MKTKLIALALLVLLSAINHQLSTASAQGTAFTYQGQLQNNGSPVIGIYNFTFTLFATNSGGTAVAGPVTNSAVAISNGLFTVTMDFGPGPWNGQTNWLQIGVATYGTSSFSTLNPRQQLTPVPYAIRAASAAAVSGISIQPNANGAPDIISGSPVNYVSSGVVGATIAGGGATFYLFGPLTNSVTADFGTVGGGFINTAGSLAAVVAGGAENTASGQTATVGGGDGNTASGFAATVAGGQSCTAGGTSATVTGGYNNTASGNYATVDGGSNNMASGACSFAAGQNAQAANNGSFVWSDGSGFTASSSANQFLARASGGFILFSSANNNSGFYLNDGNVGIGNSIPQNALDMYGNITTRGNGLWTFGVNSSGNMGFVPLVSGPDVAYIDPSGNYHQVSDLRLKQDITNLDDSLDRLLQLRPVSYHFRSAPTNAPLTLGFIAQEVQPLFPEIVGVQTNGVKDLVYSELIPVTIRSIQQLNQKLEEQAKEKDTEIADLKARLNTLEKIVNKQKSS